MPQTSVDIRNATSADIPVLTRARRLMFEELDDFESAVLDRVDAEFVIYMEREMAAGRVTGWIAEDTATGEWVGALANEWARMPTNPRIGLELRSLLFGLFVKQEYRRRGVARSLVNAAVEAARAAGAGAVQLHASDAGRPLYESIGFSRTSEMRLILHGGGTERDSNRTGRPCV
ncbi:MAG: GNAT family N-acetyltransferase [Coriobacteriia bacterium]